VLVRTGELGRLIREDRHRLAQELHAEVVLLSEVLSALQLSSGGDSISIAKLATSMPLWNLCSMRHPLFRPSTRVRQASKQPGVWFPADARHLNFMCC
jgi:hypothetical protein